MDNKRNEQIIWSDSFSVGIKLIDDQHQGLFDITNNLYSHVTGNEDEERAYFDEVINQALDYVKNHFVTEEKCMLATNFPDYHKHKKTHDEFTFTVLRSVNEFKSGKSIVLEKFAGFLKEWILSHIAVMDKQYSLYFRKIAAIKRDGKLAPSLESVVNTYKPAV
ncbi:MAG: bacteriohemerythrin [Treponema sp.]|nr:bacteriohemerythrin [Treponema sp.]